jgi:hypothetical protein
MKNQIYILLLFSFICTANAQESILASGGNCAGSGGSASYSIGQIGYSNSSNNFGSVNDGVQQPYFLNLNLKLFLQGYYQANGLMQNVYFNQGVTSIPGNDCDLITIELHENNSPYNLILTTNKILDINGNINIESKSIKPQKCFVSIKHRNSLESWSNEMNLQENVQYDFSLANTQVYGNNQIEIEPMVWAFYSGDINQDGYIDGFDYPYLDADIQANIVGTYTNTDLNGDGYVDSFDFPIYDINSSNSVNAIIPN